jgi:hypothetical protein
MLGVGSFAMLVGVIAAVISYMEVGHIAPVTSLPSIVLGLIVIALAMKRRRVERPPRP